MPDELPSGSTATSAKSASAWQHPTGRAPETVALVACGPTQAAWHAAHIGYHRPFTPRPEVWTLNKALRTVKADLGFVMDDMVGEGRRADTYREDLDGVTIPIITSEVDDATRAMYPHADLRKYPLSEVLWYAAYVLERRTSASDTISPAKLMMRRDAVCYQHNSLPYIMAYALYIGVKTLMLFGVDYTHPSNPQEAREDDRANAEFWCGVLTACGVRLVVPDSTSLLNRCYRKPMYGYGARQPLLDIPTPDDIARYCDMYAERFPT